MRLHCKSTWCNDFKTLNVYKNAYNSMRPYEYVVSYLINAKYEEKRFNSIDEAYEFYESLNIRK